MICFCRQEIHLARLATGGIIRLRHKSDHVFDIRNEHVGECPPPFLSPLDIVFHITGTMLEIFDVCGGGDGLKSGQTASKVERRCSDIHPPD